MAATKTPAKTATAKAESTEGTSKRQITAKQRFDVVDELPEGRVVTRSGRTSPYLGLLSQVAEEHSGKWVCIVTTGNSHGATHVRKNLTKRQEAGELPAGSWEFQVRRFDEKNPFPGDSSVVSALYVKHSK